MMSKIYKNLITSSRLRPTQVIVLNFFLIILVGSCLLNLPIASKDGVSVPFVDALFTATSAVCVTGLVVYSTLEQWTLFGQIVIIALIQIGGLGFMTLVTMFLVAMKKKVTLKERILIQESLNQNSLQGMVILVKRIIIGTVIFEGIGAIILAVRFTMDYGLVRGIYMGIFHSISAFCNAGFDIIGNYSLMPYVGDVVVNVVIMLLIMIGGIGFPVWMDVLKAFRAKKEKSVRTYRQMVQRLSLHTKIVLTITPILVVGGAIFFFICEYYNPMTMHELPLSDKILASFMQSVTTRTAGYFSIDQGGMTYASKFMSILLMFIGGSPSGTAGGIKTATFGVLVIAVLSVIKGRQNVSIYRRRVPFDVLQKSLAIFLLSLSAVIAVTMLLTFTERNMEIEYEFIDLLYETVSALGTVGVTTGITPYLSTAGKLLISLGMFMGRLGPITLAIALTKKQAANDDIIQYPEEKIIVG